MKLSHQTIINALHSLKLSPLLEKETDQIYLMFMINNKEVPVFFGIRGGNTLLQTIAYLPYEYPERTLGQIARLLHLLNREIDMPGFGMDESHQLLFYRCVIPCLNEELSIPLLELYLSTTRIACETFMDSISMIATGKTSLDQMLKKEPPSNEIGS